jgi:hypothetical protein
MRRLGAMSPGAIPAMTCFAACGRIEITNPKFEIRKAGS